MRHGAQTDADLRELWTRIVFNMCVSNTDDHLRNHGFILVPNRGWRLSPAFDMNPVPQGDGLTLNVSEADNAKDLDLPCKYPNVFRLDSDAARGHSGARAVHSPAMAEACCGAQTFRRGASSNGARICIGVCIARYFSPIPNHLI